MLLSAVAAKALLSGYQPPLAGVQPLIVWVFAAVPGGSIGVPVALSGLSANLGAGPGVKACCPPKARGAVGGTPHWKKANRI